MSDRNIARGRAGGRMVKRLDAARSQQLARIHMAKKGLALDEETYRALLERVTGHRSAKDMDAGQRNAVIAEFARLGFKGEAARARSSGFKGRPANVKEVPMLRKVEALLADAKRPWSYAHSLAKRMHKVARVEWCNEDQLHKLVSALQIDTNRRAKASS